MEQTHQSTTATTTVTTRLAGKIACDSAAAGYLLIKVSTLPCFCVGSFFFGLISCVAEVHSWATPEGQQRRFLQEGVDSLVSHSPEMLYPDTLPATTDLIRRHICWPAFPHCHLSCSPSPNTFRRRTHCAYSLLTRPVSHLIFRLTPAAAFSTCVRGVHAVFCGASRTRVYI